jgi:hypothetical protein
MLRDFFKFGATNESAEKRCVLSEDQPPEFAREQNRAIIAYFKQNAAWNALTGTYSLRARPDLTGELHDLIAEDTPVADVEKGSIYGWPVVANVSGILLPGRAEQTTFSFDCARIGLKLLAGMEQGLIQPTRQIGSTSTSHVSESNGA